MGILGVGIMNSTAFSLLANSSTEVDENQEMEGVFGTAPLHLIRHGADDAAPNTQTSLISWSGAMRPAVYFRGARKQ
jgi:hypothetical protein